MQFSKILAVLSFAAFAVAAPAPEAAPDAILEARTTTCTPPNACKQGSKYVKYSGECKGKDSYYCRTTAVILYKAIANCVNLLNNVNVDVKISDLVDVDLLPISV